MLIATFTETWRKSNDWGARQTTTSGEMTWHVGELPPNKKLGSSIGESEIVVHRITASDEELDYILAHFDNLPYIKTSREQIWRGDFAQFIYDNLI